MSDKTPSIIDLGDKIVGYTSDIGGRGRTQEVVEITDQDEIERIRNLIETRANIGLEISQQLISGGLGTASENEPTKITAV